MRISEIKFFPILDSLKLIDISDEEYFGSKYKKYISNSKLSLINPEQGGSPQIYKEGLGVHQKFIDSMVFGSAVHEMVLQPNDFCLADGIDRPTAKLGFMADELFPSYRVGQYILDEDVISASNKIDYFKGKMNENKIQNVKDRCSKYWEDRFQYEKSELSKTPIYLDPKSREKLTSCLESINNNKEVQSLLHPKKIVLQPITYAESCLLMDVQVVFPDKKELVLSLKSKIDHFSVNFDTNEIVLNDLKTTGHLIEDFQESFYKYHYYRQMAMYGWMLFMFSGMWDISNPTMKSNMLLISTIPNYRCGVFKVLDTHINRGLSEFSELLKRVAYHERFGYDAGEPEL